MKMVQDKVQKQKGAGATREKKTHDEDKKEEKTRRMRKKKEKAVENVCRRRNEGPPRVKHHV